LKKFTQDFINRYIKVNKLSHDKYKMLAESDEFIKSKLKLIDNWVSNIGSDIEIDKLEDYIPKYFDDILIQFVKIMKEEQLKRI